MRIEKYRLRLRKEEKPNRTDNNKIRVKYDVIRIIGGVKEQREHESIFKRNQINKDFLQAVKKSNYTLCYK